MNCKNLLLIAMLFCIASLNAQTNFEIAYTHLLATEKYSENDLSDLSVTDEYESRHNQITHLYLQQNYQGISIQNANTNFNIKSGTIRSNGGFFIANLFEKVNTTSNSISATQALQKVMSDHEIFGNVPAIQQVENTAEKKTIFEKGEIASELIEVRLVYFAQEEQLKLSWEVSLYEKSCDNWWITTVDALTGEILNENNHVLHCTFHNHNKTSSVKNKIKHLAEISLIKNATVATDCYNVYAYPVESPNHGSRTLQTSPWLDAGDAGLLGWHDDGTSEYTTTRGNNADAYNDQNNSNGATGGDDARAEGGVNLNFDFPIDLTTDPEVDPDPYVTNLFYWNNLMHDVWYQYGFDEVSGNFQEDNQGRGGSESDYVRAEAQDGGGTNNANFSTPSDGSNPRMQMYLWSPASTDFLIVNTPEVVAGSYEMAPAGFGGSMDTPLTGDVVEVDDGTAIPSQGCQALVNAAAVSGKIALIDRDGCQFGTKCLNAQNAGAIGVIVCNTVAGLVTMGPGADGGQVTIPAVMIGLDDCTTIRAELANNLNVTMSVSENPPLDGDLDNGIIAHEYGHGISIRLTGGPGNSNCLNNAEQMGEGWSDFFGIWMTTENGDQHTDSRGVGTYALGESTTDDGIRPAPYTTDMTVNSYTYGNVDDSGISQPHGIGFIWCTMIWDLNWAMINEHGYNADLYNGTGGNNKTAQLILDGLKGQGCSPGFVDGRDAILQADVDNNAEANKNIIWNVFARRGLGYSASQGSSSSRSDQTEAFDLPPGVPLIEEEELFGDVALPVDFTAFNAIADDKKQQIDLFWSTASESNNKGFDLQRSSESDPAFQSLTWLDANPNADGFASYFYNDKNVKPGEEYYYRLRQIDFNEQENYSEVVHAKLNDLATEIQVFPNPTRGNTSVQFSDEIRGIINMQVLNAQGQIIGVQSFETDGGAELEVNLSRQPEGIYFLKFEIGERQVVKRIVRRN